MAPSRLPWPAWGGGRAGDEPRKREDRLRVSGDPTGAAGPATVRPPRWVGDSDPGADQPPRCPGSHATPAVIPEGVLPPVRRSPNRIPSARQFVGVYGPAGVGMTENLPRLLNDRTLTV